MPSGTTPRRSSVRTGTTNATGSDTGSAPSTRPGAIPSPSGPSSVASPAPSSSRSCHLCHHRKVRCDKKDPCTPCSRAGKPCTYPPAGQPVRRPRKTTMADVASRISQLEKSLSTQASSRDASAAAGDVDGANAVGASGTGTRTGIGTRSSASALAPASASPARNGGRDPGPTALPSHAEDSRSRRDSADRDDRRGNDDGGGDILLQRGSSSQYFNEVLLSRIIEEEHDVHSVLSTPHTSASDTAHSNSNANSSANTITATGDNTTNTTPLPSTQPNQHAPSSFSSPSPPSSCFSPMGILSAPSPTITPADMHPSQSIARRLWTTYLDLVDLSLGPKLMHVPTDEIRIYRAISDPAAAPYEDMALCFAVYYATLSVMDPSEASSIVGGDVLAVLSRFKAGLEQAFARANFLDDPTIVCLQAFVIYLNALRLHNHSKSVWILNGLAQRTAKSIGLHVDPARLGLSPFECERRRRLWWQIEVRDCRSAEDYGIQNTTTFPLSLHSAILRHLEKDGDQDNNDGTDVRMPLNIYDGELYPEMKELPAERPSGTWTPMTLPIIRIDFVKAYRRVEMLVAAEAAAEAASNAGGGRGAAERGPSTNGHAAGATAEQAASESPGAAIAAIDDERYEAIRSLIVRQTAERIEERLKNIDPVVPRQRLSRTLALFVLRKMDMVSRQQRVAIRLKRQRRLAPSSISPSRPSYFAALAPSDSTICEVLEMSESCLQFMDDEFLGPFSRSYPQYHVVLQLLWYLCMRPDGPYVARVWRSVDGLSDMRHSWAAIRQDPFDDGKGAVLRALRAKAESIRARTKSSATGRGGPNGAGDDHVEMPGTEQVAGADMGAPGEATGPTFGSPNANGDPGTGSFGEFDYGGLYELGFAVTGDMPDWQWLAQGFQADGGEGFPGLWPGDNPFS